MSWGSELWDQYNNLAHHTHKGIDFLEKYSQFIKERCSIETEYAYKLRKLVKNYQPKKKEEGDNQFSTWSAFSKMLNEINDIAGQHEIISEMYSGQINREISDLSKELKEERKKHLHEGSRHQSTLQNSLLLLDKNKKSYEKSFKEAEKANESFAKIDADINLSRADVEKARAHAQIKNRLCEEFKTEYANQLQKTNELQRVHYTDHMPNIFQQLQDMEERRIACVQNFIKRTADIHKQVLPIIQKCLEGIIGAAEAIDPKEDSMLVIEKYKTGFPLPEDVPFEDLSNPRNGDISSNNLTVPTSKTESSTVRGTLSGKNRRRGGILNFFSNSKNTSDETREACSDLPPNQRRKKLAQKIENIKSQIQQETAARDGLMKMKHVYEQNSYLGDPLSVEGELAENGVKLEKLQAELQKYQGFMAEAEAKLAGHSIREHRNSVSEDSLSRSASDSSVCNPSNTSYKFSTPSTPQQSHGFSNSPESGIGTSQPSIHDTETEAYPEPDPEFDNDYNEYNEDFDGILGTGKALYPFTGQSEGSIDLAEGEEFDVVELDQGDGWTRVRKRNFEEGFVPTSYIETVLYNAS